MTEREAIASLKTLCNTCTMFPKCVNNKPECFQAIEMAISALKKQEADRWTPCKEKMPAKPFGCFVTVMDTNPITQEEFENILPYFVGWDGEQWNDADGEQIPCEVLAWRPLPKPYTEEEQDGLRQNIQTIVDQCGYSLDEIATVLQKMKES